MEGILMRGPKKQAIVCRTADGLVEKVEDLKLLKDKYPFFGLPLVRGVVIFLDSMIKGMGALLYSAELLPEEMQEDDPLDKWIEAHFSAEKAKQVIIYTAVVLGIGLSLFLFVFLPTFLVGFIKPIYTNFFLRNLSEGVVRIALLLLWWPQHKRSTPFHWSWFIPLISLFLSAADFCYFYSLSLDGAMISIVSMIRRGSVVVSFLFGALAFHEKNLKAKVIDLLLVLLSMVLLFIGSQ